MAYLLNFLYEKNLETSTRLLQNQVKNLAIDAALLVDGEQHKVLTKLTKPNNNLYSIAIEDLVTFHNHHQELFYVYTMYETNGKTFFILDTAEEYHLKTTKKLRKSKFKEEYTENNLWINTLKSGEAYVNPKYETDSYGTFISGHAPIKTKYGEITGFVGVDVDVTYFKKWEEQLKKELHFALLLSIILGIAFAIVSFVIYNKLHKSKEQMEHLSLVDPLTKAWNRRSLIMNLEIETEHYKRNQRPFSVLIIDADFFKKINDTYGHDAGDITLQQLVIQLKEVCRKNDFIARFGGEEFVVILRETDLSGAKIIAEKIREHIAETPIQFQDGTTIRITVSIGATRSKKSDDTYKTIISRADEALYQAKNQGRNQVNIL